jgi:phosphatidylserine/phosphatidylglycerophosphate/cardiolipin synthase-like enzyme
LYSPRVPEKCVKHESSKRVSVSEELGLNEEHMMSKTGVYTLEGGSESFVARLWFCENAQQTLDIQYYSVAKDNCGFIFCDYLLKAADRGVKVRLLLDALAKQMSMKDIQTLDSHENIEVRIYNPGVKHHRNAWLRVRKTLHGIRRIDQRMHIKTFTVDGTITITGGRNIADRYFDYDPKYNFRDRDIVLFGKAASTVKSSFEDYWNDTLSIHYEGLRIRKQHRKDYQKRYNRLHHYVCDPKNLSDQMIERILNYPLRVKDLNKSEQLLWLDNVSYVSDKPAKNNDRNERKGGVCHDSLIEILKQTKTSLDLQSPYLITLDDGKKFFKAMVDRGVKLRVITNSLCSTDNENAFSGYQRDRKENLETGMQIYEFKPNAAVRNKLMTAESIASLKRKSVYGFHPKTMIIDDEVSVIGSYNFDPRSADLNTESVVIIRSKEFSKLLFKHVNEEFLPENAWHTTLDYNPDSEAGLRKKWKAASRIIFPKKVL